MESPKYPCCEHCGSHPWLPPSGHVGRCLECQTEADAIHSYAEAAVANPERRNNGCMIYRRGS